MSDPPLSYAHSRSKAKGIPALSETSTASSASASSSSFGAPKSSISRKKPMGLDISASIKPTRAPPALPGSDPKDLEGLSEAEKLRRDIERLQLNSASSSSHSLLDSPMRGGESSESGAEPEPGTGRPAAVLEKGSGGGSTTKKGSGGSKKKKLDKDGWEVVKDEDLEVLQELGAGNGGTVTKVWNKKRSCVMARKLILVDAKPAVRKQILRELQIMNDCSSPYIVDYYGCFPIDVHVGIVMEYMDAGSLDYIYRKNGAVPIAMVGKVAEAVLRGLMYLYDVHRIIHRDIKPSNVLANTRGEIKVCDFGVSGELINSIANTFVGTSTYMSPERIKGDAYTIKSDVWSLGVSLIELATARFPFRDPPDSASDTESGSSGVYDDDDDDGFDDSDYDPDPTLPISTQRPRLSSLNKAKDPGAGSANGNGRGKEEKHQKRKSKGVSLAGGGHTMSILDLLQHIVHEPAPKLVSARRKFPTEAVAFVAGCLDKDPAARKSPQELLASAWITNSSVTPADIKAWAVSVAGSSE